jgi:hypothetical protein
MYAQAMHFATPQTRQPAGDMEEIGLQPTPSFTSTCQEYLR